MWGALTALYEAAQVVMGLVRFAETVFGLASPSNSVTLAEIEAELEAQSEEIRQYSAQILAAISQINQEILGEKMAEELAHADEAGVALALWEKDHEDSARQQALDTSESGLAGMVELYTNQV